MISTLSSLKVGPVGWVASFKWLKELLADSDQRDLTKARQTFSCHRKRRRSCRYLGCQRAGACCPPGNSTLRCNYPVGSGPFRRLPDILIENDPAKVWYLSRPHNAPRAPVREAAVARVEKLLSPDGSNLVPMMHTLYSGHRDFKKAIDAGMCAAFGEDFEDLVFGPAADQRVQLRNTLETPNRPGFRGRSFRWNAALSDVTRDSGQPRAWHSAWHIDSHRRAGDRSSSAHVPDYRRVCGVGFRTLHGGSYDSFAGVSRCVPV